MGGGAESGDERDEGLTMARAQIDDGRACVHELLAMSKTKLRIDSYWGIERASMSSKTRLPPPSNVQRPLGM